MSTSKSLSISAAATLIAMMSGTALAEPSLVKFSSAGNGSYDVEQIQEFDWQSSGDLIVVDKLPVPVTVNGKTFTTFTTWAAAATPGDTVTFNVHYHARLNAMLSNEGGNIAPLSLSKNGATCAAGDCFEVTVAASGEESAHLVAPGLLMFDSLRTNYKVYYDDTPDSKVATPGTTAPTNFTDGTVIMEGTSVSVAGTFTFGSNGSQLISNTISSYDSQFIETDTVGLQTLNASTFDGLVSQPGSLQAIVKVGQAAGLQPYVVLKADGRLKADANSEFAALAPQDEGQCRVTGGGNDIDENLLIAANLNQPFPNSGTMGYTFNKTRPNQYTYGGQVGAPTLLAPGPFGEWTHHQKAGQTDDFVFHAGTHSAPSDTKIRNVKCSDPNACKPAEANAGFKQIDFDGVGSFRSLKKGGTVNGQVVTTDQGGGGTRHYFRVHIEDLGEPGGSGGPKPNTCSHVPGSLADGTTCTDCPDIYQIEIHATINPDSAIIYTVGAYVDGGNLQIHPPVGH